MFYRVGEIKYMLYYMYVLCTLNRSSNIRLLMVYNNNNNNVLGQYEREREKINTIPSLRYCKRAALVNIRVYITDIVVYLPVKLMYAIIIAEVPAEVNYHYVYNTNSK